MIFIHWDLIKRYKGLKNRQEKRFSNDKTLINAYLLE